MSINNCALSGLPLQNPVFCIPSGYIYEKSVIEKYVSRTQQDPLNGAEIVDPASQLVDIKIERQA